MTNYLEEVHKAINDYLYFENEQYDSKYQYIAKDASAYFRKKYLWMTQENLIHTINRALYYAWHG